MPRTARIYQRAICYHVMNRGVNRQPIFEDDHDRVYFSRTVAEYRELCGAKIYHWCWMDNHYHMLVEVVFENLRGFVGGLQQAYAQYHHARHQSSGVFWQGRFKSRPVEIGEYLGCCGRYIERNPVRAGMTEKAWDYRWSSATSYLNGVKDCLTDENPYIGAFEDADRHAYSLALMPGVEDEAVIHNVDGNCVIGRQEFPGTLEVEHGRHRIKPGRPYRNKSQ